MKSMPRTAILALMLPLLSAFASAADKEPAKAAKEIRTFRVLVGDRESGSYTISTQPLADGTTLMNAAADIEAKVLIRTYKFTLRAAEVWKDDRLMRLESQCNDDGKRFKVSATGTDEGLSITVNDKTALTKGLVFSSTWWKLPAEKYREVKLPAVESDSGAVHTVKLEKVGVSEITLNGKVFPCLQYRLTGEQKADLWYDGDGRLVRQVTVELGQKTTLELASIKREALP